MSYKNNEKHGVGKNKLFSNRPSRKLFVDIKYCWRIFFYLLENFLLVLLVGYLDYFL
jgi:hypothetical protein